MFCLLQNAHSQSKDNIIDSLENELVKNQNLRTLADKRDYIKIDTTRVNILNFQTIELINKFDFKRAELLANKALEIADRISFKRGQANCYNNLGNLYRRQSDYPKALQNLERALKIAKEINYKSAIANAYNNIGLVNNNLSNYQEASKFYFEALKIREELNDKLGAAKSYNNLGAIFTKTGDSIQALNYFIIAIKIFKELDDKGGLLNSYNNLGVIYFNNGKYVEALPNFLNCLELSLEIGDKLGFATANNNIGETYCLMEDFKKALDYNSKTLVLQKAINNNFGVVRGFKNLAQTYKGLKEFRIARIYIDSAVQLSKKIGTRQLTRDSYKLLSDIDSLNLDWKNAYNNFKLYTLYNDSILNKANLEKMKQSQIQYELEKKDLEYKKLIDLKAIQFEYKQKQALAKTEEEKLKLSYEQKIKEQKLNFEYSKKIGKAEAEQKQQLALNKILTEENDLMTQNSKNEFIIRYLMILASLAFVAFGINYYRNFKKQKAANIIIAKQGEDLKALINELNHRVKNNFQTVGSMLSMQTRFLEDKKLIDILLQTKNRFLAISNVHEKLYQLENFSNLPIIDYMKDIVENIADQFGINNTQFEFTITDNCNLKTNIQTVLPLVLIVNELITNSFKHAYSENSKLLVNISITNIKENKHQLVYTDNGPGLQTNFSESNQFGKKMLKLFAEQLNGELSFKSENGAVFMITFEYD